MKRTRVIRTKSIENGLNERNWKPERVFKRGGRREKMNAINKLGKPIGLQDNQRIESRAVYLRVYSANSIPEKPDSEMLFRREPNDRSDFVETRKAFGQRKVQLSAR